MSSAEIAGINWSGDRVLPAFQAPQHLTIFDMRGASPEVQLTATTMAGLINRPQPMAYLLVGDDDAFWLKELLAYIPRETSPSTGDDVLEGMLITFRSCTKGMIIYDPNLVDSINIATTLAGQRDAIVVSPAQAQNLQQPFDLPVLADLRTYQWRNRLQAYAWAQQNLLNGASPHLVAGLDPKIGPGIRAFLVANRAFVYWLDSRNFLPDLSNGFQSERGLMEDIFKAFAPGAVHLGWFIDEGSGVTLTSKAAIPVLASDLSTNLEVWTSVPLATTIARPTPVVNTGSPAPSKMYISFTVSDGDNLQYDQHRLLRLWRDPARGSFPLGWTISPVLLQAAPAMAAYYTHTATANDELLAGPSGAGYMFPSRWPIQRLPAFLQHTGQLMQHLGQTTLEVLDIDFLQSTGIPIIANLRQTGMAFTDTALQQQFIQALTPFGLHALLSGSGVKKPGWTLSTNHVPIYQNLGLADSVAKTVELVRNATAANQQRPLFLNIYIMAWSMTPTDIKQVIQQLGNDYEVVTPGALLKMIAQT